MRPFLLVASVLVYVAAVVAQEPVSVDDTDPSIRYYSPSGSWTKHVNQEARFQLWNNSDTFTERLGATITWSFRGTSIEYWGNTGTYHGPCGIQVDGRSFGNVSSNAASTGPPIQLFRLAGLDPAAEHTIVITVVANAFPNVCELDRFIYTPVATNTGSGNPTGTRSGNNNPTGSSTRSSNDNARPTTSNGTGSNQSTDSSGSNTPWGIIGGAVGGGVVGGILLAVLFVWYCRRRKARKDLEDIVAEQPSLPVIAMSESHAPFPPRPLSQKQQQSLQGQGPTKAQMAAAAAAARPPSSVYSSVPPTSNYASSAVSSDGQFRPQSLAMPHPYPDMSSRHPSTYGSEVSYGGPTSPALSTHSQRPLLVHNPTPSTTSAGHAHVPPVPASPTMPLQPHPLSPTRRPTVVLSASNQVGAVEDLGPDEKRRFDRVPSVTSTSHAGPSTSSRPSSGSEAKTTSLIEGPSSTPATAAGPSSPRPLVQHQDAGIVTPTPAPAAEPEELPPAYNAQWQSGQRQ